MGESKVVEAPELSDSAGTIAPDVDINEKSLLRKIDARLLPAVGILYLLSFLDRSNGVVFYFSMWYKRRERQYRISLFFSAASLAGAFGGILAYPTIIKNLGYTAAKAQLLTIPPYAVAFITTLSVAVASERLGKRAVFIAGSSAVAAIGYILLLANTDPTSRPGVSYAGTFFAAAGIYPATALVLSWPAINVSGQTKRAIANAMQISIGNLGAVMGTQLYRADDGPRFIVGHSMALAYLIGNIVVVSLLGWRLKRENAKRSDVASEITDVGEVKDWKGDSDVRWRYEW
ncbi:hypothetical protein G7Z17_g11924 [Cylindrodendrum hubeiense]|uniref:Uncharacterized protein n=1 Tax=Cylindrodendrum hubeiense TaxID=595255 RepID=A0A9P5H305_9HYPO|nr:hypothetical protein G7Z17_g11924 [Cylindrodendrum hubeiense]